METTRQIDIASFRNAFLNISDYLDEEGITTIDLDHDYYWAIDFDELFNVYETPSDLTIGQLYDDWEQIERLSKDVKDITPFDLIWFASVCRYVGERLMQ